MVVLAESSSAIWRGGDSGRRGECLTSADVYLHVVSDYFC